MTPKILIEIKNGTVHRVVVTGIENPMVTVVDYDGLTVGEGISITEEDALSIDEQKFNLIMDEITELSEED